LPVKIGPVGKTFNSASTKISGRHHGPDTPSSANAVAAWPAHSGAHYFAISRNAQKAQLTALGNACAP
jgi:hypothetical protein